MTKDAKKAIKFYKKNGYIDKTQEQAILSSMTDEEIMTQVRPFQEKYLKKKISNIASRLYKEESFENIYYIVKEFNSIRNISTEDNKTLEDLYALSSQFLSKYDYTITHNIVLNGNECEFSNFNPFIDIHYCDKDEFNGLFNLKSDGKYYTGILANAILLKRNDLAEKIVKNVLLPFFENYNNSSDLVLDNGYSYKNSILTIDKNYIDTMDFMETFDIKFNLEKELYFDCFGKVMASMCLPIRKKDDYELTKDRIKEEFCRYNKASDKVYSELFYEVLYRNFSKKEKMDLVDLYIQNTIKAIMKCKEEDRKIDMLYDMTRYFTESINVVSEMWDTFKITLFKNEMYPYNNLINYDKIAKMFLENVEIKDHKFENMFMLYDHFVIEELAINKESETKKYASLGFLPTLKKDNCNLILNEIFNNLIKPMYANNDKNVKELLDWYRLNGYEI